MNEQKKIIGILIPSVEVWSSFHGGAVSRFCNEMLKNTNMKSISFKVFGRSCNTNFRLPGNLEKPIFGMLFVKLDLLLARRESRFSGLFYILSMWRRLKKCDLIHIHNRAYYPKILRKLGYNGKIILHVHNDLANSSELFIKQFIEASDIVLSCSQAISDRIYAKYSGDKQNAAVLYNGVDLNQFKVNNDWSSRKNRIVFVGRIDQIKGVHHLVASFVELKRGGVPWSLSIIGGPSFGDRHKMTPYLQSIQSMIEEVNEDFPEAIDYVGYIHNQEITTYYQESKIFCLPSVVHEAFPLVVLEAMACGAFVVASNMGGIPEGTGGFAYLAEPTQAGLKAQLERAINQEEEVKELAKKGAKRIHDEFSWLSISEKLDTIYYNLVSDEGK